MKKRVEAFARNFSFLAVILIRLLEKQNSLHLPVFSIFFSLRLFQNIGKFGAKKYFTDHGTVNTIQLIVAIKGNLSIYSVSEQVAAKGNSPDTF